MNLPMQFGCKLYLSLMSFMILYKKSQIGFYLIHTIKLMEFHKRNTFVMF